MSDTAARARRRVLIVDDNVTNTKLAQFVLSSKGYDVRTAIDAEQALTVVTDFNPELILMDLQLPGIDGLTLTRRLKAEPSTRHIVIVATTAYAMKGDDERAFQAGCDGYITKPINTRTLARQIDNFVNMRI